MKVKHLILPAVLALTLGGCSLPSASKTVDQVKQSVEEKAATQEILKNCKYDKPICQYMAAQIGVYNSGMTLTSTTMEKGKSANNESVTMIDGKGNIHNISTENGKEIADMIMFNNVTYIKDYTDGKWTKIAAPEGKEEANPLNPANTIEALKKDFESEEIKTVYTKLGQEACGSMAPGLTCDIYEMYEPEFQEEGKIKMWIDTKEHLARKMEMALGEDSTNVVVYSYGAVTITEPSPVKEFTLPSFGGGSGMPSQADLEKMMQDLPAETEGE